MFPQSAAAVEEATRGCTSPEAVLFQSLLKSHEIVGVLHCLCLTLVLYSSFQGTDLSSVDTMVPRSCIQLTCWQCIPNNLQQLSSTTFFYCLKKQKLDQGVCCFWKPELSPFNFQLTSFSSLCGIYSHYSVCFAHKQCTDLL